jgi:hypothetical protein
MTSLDVSYKGSANQQITLPRVPKVMPTITRRYDNNLGRKVAYGRTQDWKQWIDKH